MEINCSEENKSVIVEVTALKKTWMVPSVEIISRDAIASGTLRSASEGTVGPRQARSHALFS